MIMKKIILFAGILLTSMYVIGQSETYKKEMEKNTIQLDTATTMSTYSVLSTAFDKLVKAEPKEWLPPYYAAYCLIKMAGMERSNEKTDELLNRADVYTAKADSLSKDNSEISLLLSIIASTRVKVDPQARSMKYGMESEQQLQNAKELNPDNPRVYFIKAQNVFYTPKQWGGGKDKAKPMLEETIKKFTNYKSESNLMPHWGEKEARDLLARASQ
jgi:hypothetical protein